MNQNLILEKKIPLSDLLGFLKDMYFFSEDSAVKAPEQKMNWGQGSEPRRQSFNKQNRTSASVI